MIAADGERKRIKNECARLRALIQAVELGLDHPPTSEAAQAVAQAATGLVAACARLDVLDRMERESAAVARLDEVKK